MMIYNLKTLARERLYKNDRFKGLYEELSHYAVCAQRIIPDYLFLKMKFPANVGYKPNIKYPTTFNEKMQWLKLYNRHPEYTKMADKYEVRKFVKSRIGEEYLNILYGVYDRFADIDIDGLPKSFVIKCTHDSGSVVLCKKKSSLNVEKTRKVINKGLRRNYFWGGREWPYKNISPRIIVEKLIENKDGSAIDDYKVFCFGGEPKIIQVDYDRFTDHKRNLYDVEWNYLPYTTLYPTDPNHIINKPECLTELIDCAKKLAKGTPFLRTDFYVVDNRPIFGEITFFHGGGMEPFIPKEWDYRLGKMLVLPKKNLGSVMRHERTKEDAAPHWE